MTIDPSPPNLRLPVSQPYRDARHVPYNGPGWCLHAHPAELVSLLEVLVRKGG